MKRAFVFVASAIFITATGAGAEIVGIAGADPERRPDWAPEITTYDKSGDWYQHALSGVVPPYPSSLRFLEDQGGWYSPFSRPGMIGPYDIRNWHPAETAD